MENPEGLSQWLRQHGFPATCPARGQEHIFALGCTVDARVVLLEAVYVMITVEQSRTVGVPNPPTVTVRRPARPGRPCCQKGHEQLDQVDLAEICLMRVPMLKSCPFFCVVDCGSVSQ